jgi:hypothetical protein
VFSRDPHTACNSHECLRPLASIRDTTRRSAPRRRAAHAFYRGKGPCVSRVKKKQATVSTSRSTFRMGKSWLMRARVPISKRHLKNRALASKNVCSVDEQPVDAPEASHDPPEKKAITVREECFLFRGWAKWRGQSRRAIISSLGFGVKLDESMSSRESCAFKAARTCCGTSFWFSCGAIDSSAETC